MRDFLKNKKQREAFARIFAKHFNAIAVNEEGKITEEDIQKLLNDPKKEQLHLKAKKFIDTNNQKINKLHQVREDNHLKLIDPAIARIISCKINLEDTPEAEQENIQLIKTASTRLGKERFCQEFLKNITKSKPSEVLPKQYDMEHIVEKVTENGDIYYAGFCVVDMLNETEMSPETKEYYQRCGMFIQNYGTILNGMNGVANEAFLAVPDKVFIDPENGVLASMIINDVLDEFAQEFPEIDKNDKKDLSEIGGQITSVSFFKKEFNFYKNEIDNGHMDKGVMNSGCYKVDGKICTRNEMEDAISNPDKHSIEYVPYDEEESRKIDGLIDKGFDVNYQKGESGLYEYKAVSENEIMKQTLENFEINEFAKNFLAQEKAEKKTNFFFSMDTKAYKDMDKAMTQLKKHLQNYMMPDDDKKTQARRKHPENFVDGKGLIDEIKHVTQLVDDYKAHKIEDKKNGTINKRGNRRLEMATNLSEFLHGALELDSLIDAPTGPIVKIEEFPELDNNLNTSQEIVNDLDVEMEGPKPTKEQLQNEINKIDTIEVVKEDNAVEP